MKTTFLLGVHSHQPIDNFDYVIYDAIEKSYKPFFQTVQKFPDFKFSVHFSGWLLEFIQKNDKELFSLIKSLSKQIEFFTGGFYEPILASIPAVDRIAQIKKLSNYIKKHFNQTPKGLWLTERVWDNSIIRDIKQCNVEYVIVDDYHLISTGVDVKDTTGYFITEEGGDSIGIFPINQELRYAIPFYDLETTNNLLHSFENTQGKNAAILFDDGEKFGIWPKTYETVYEKKWLEDFITQTLADEKIECKTFKDYYMENKPLGLVYLPTVSYSEMGKWSLKCAEAIKVDSLMNSQRELSHFINGGTWKNFFNKYQESNWIQKRFLELSNKQGTSTKYKEALYKSQCNDVLWHGVFGGIYLPNLRDNTYKYIIDCETMLKTSKETIDIDMDGYDEYKFKSENLLTIISSKHGGQIVELDLLDEKYNLQNTLTRHEEAYHKEIVIGDSSLEEKEELITIHDNKLLLKEDMKIIIDWYLKKSAIDHIVNAISCESFFNNSFHELGDFANQPYEESKNRSKKISLKRDGGIYLDKKFDTKIEKSYKFLKNSIEIDIGLKSSFTKKLYYFHEWNLHFANIQEVSFNNLILEDNQSTLKLHTSELIIKDRYTKKIISFSFQKDIDILIVPLNTISQSEKGLDITNQGISFGFVFDFVKSFNTIMQFTIKDI
ncbi:MAG: alpha-amylase/4-alpha-glucanotransferase domain-containing protein [Campylobacterota bacterium]